MGCGCKGRAERLAAKKAAAQQAALEKHEAQVAAQQAALSVSNSSK